MAPASPFPKSHQRPLPKGCTIQRPRLSPPPAYTPPRSQFVGYRAGHGGLTGPLGAQVNVPLQPTVTTVPTNTGNSDEEDEDSGSPISLRINTAINVSSNNNLICITQTPADHANAIANAVVQAIQENSSGKCGIPMIDEDGHPRPLNIEVDAGMVVNGYGNVVGNDDIINEALRRRCHQRQEEADDENEDQSPAKRIRLGH